MFEIGVDGFCGGGGVAVGIREALGVGPAIAINHDPEAIIMYQANHPAAEVYHENIWKVSPAAAAKGRPVGYAWFSPDCTHHSVAKGGKPVENKRRGLAWVVMRWINQVRPRVIFLENVPEFENWGPLIRVQSKKKSLFDQWEYVPDPKKKGMTFRLFVNRMRGYGYTVQWRKLVAADYGDPTSIENSIGGKR